MVFDYDHDIHTCLEQTGYPHEKPVGWVIMTDPTKSPASLDSVYLVYGTDYTEITLLYNTELFLYT